MNKTNMKMISVRVMTVLSILLILLGIITWNQKANATSFATQDFSNAVLSIVPVYSGSPAVAVNGNVPFFSTAEITTNSFEYYSDLDCLGRCGMAFANISKATMPTQPRGEIGMVKPSGWQTVKYNGLIEGNYLYNRCHLIGYQLAGENANARNLITGTRYFNTYGMLPYENQVANYIDTHPNSHVTYRVTPIYADGNLVASGVLMEAFSVEDGGAGCKFCVYVYNIQPGFSIDYSNGNSILVDAGKCVTSSSTVTNSSITAPANNSITNNTAALPAGVYYIGNARNGKLHVSTCKSLPASKNQRVFSTKQEAMTAGYTDPCGNCHP